MIKLIEQLQAGYKRHYRSVVAFAAVVIIALCYGLFIEQLGNGDSHLPIQVAAPLEIIEEATSSEMVSLTRSAPVTLRIPAIELETDFEKQLGLNYDGTVEVPDSYDAVGWYQFGPTPGEIGPAVILGHVDSYQGPAVFYRLGQLEVGDEIFVDRADGTTVKFLVTKLSRHEQAGFPTAQVYGDIDHAGLRLITCTGVYSHDTLRYSHNLIVFAQMVKE